MKKQILMSLMAIAVVVGLSAAVQAQSQREWKANIPYEFVAGEKTLPAGDYTVTVVNPSSDRPALRIQNADGKAVVIVQTMAGSGKSQDGAKLWFRNYADQYFFAGVQQAGDPATLTIARGRRERETLQQMIGQSGKPGTLVAVKSRK
jgi:hypothetical protein